MDPTIFCVPDTEKNLQEDYALQRNQKLYLSQLRLNKVRGAVYLLQKAPYIKDVWSVVVLRFVHALALVPFLAIKLSFYSQLCFSLQLKQIWLLFICYCVCMLRELVWYLE
jgi:hypothetical protein